MFIMEKQHFLLILYKLSSTLEIPWRGRTCLNFTIQCHRQKVRETKQAHPEGEKTPAAANDLLHVSLEMFSCCNLVISRKKDNYQHLQFVLLLLFDFIKDF